MRYWLYSIYMDPKMCEVVQRDTDVMWWSRDPTLEMGVDAAGKAKNRQASAKMDGQEVSSGPHDQRRT
jgi:hypothetical protein